MTVASDASASRARRTSMNVPYRMFRRLLSGAPLTVTHSGRQVTIEPGDYIDAALLPQVASLDRRRLAPPVSAGEVARELGITIDAGQVVAIGAANGGGASAGFHGGFQTNFQTDYFQTDFHAHALLTGGLATIEVLRRFAADDNTPDVALCLLSRDVWPFDSPVAPLATAMHRAAAAHPYVDALFAVGNRTAPFDLPMMGEPSSSGIARLPGGWAAREIAQVLAGAPMPGSVVVGAVPDHATMAAVALTRAGARIVADGGTSILRCAVVADTFVWAHPSPHVCHDSDMSPPWQLLAAMDVARAQPAHDTARRRWPGVAETVRRRVATAPAPGLPVVLWTTAVGPWGGVGVLYQLAQRLNDRGFHAFVAYKYDQAEHSYGNDVAPLKVRSPAQLASEWRSAVGDTGGIIIASNWSSGDVVNAIQAKNPGVVATTIMQDREDMFEQPGGGRANPAHFVDYLRIGHGAAVSQWVIDTARRDLGVRGDYSVIPAGIDLDIFHPPAIPRAQSHDPAAPVRVLAMWRPQTDVRRGVRRLREVYDRLHAEYGRGVSLELFGWNDASGMGKAPEYARHHGKLTPRAVADLMRAVDIVVEPSEYQGWGCSGAEALACGAALASTACFGPADYIRHGENALMVPHDELFGAVAQLVEDAPLRHRLGAQSIIDAPAYGYERVADLWTVRLCDLWRERGDGRFADAVSESGRIAAQRLSAQSTGRQ